MCTQAKYSRNKSLLAGWLAHTKMQKVFILSKKKEKKKETTCQCVEFSIQQLCNGVHGRHSSTQRCTAKIYYIKPL